MMASPTSDYGFGADWLKPRTEQHGLQRYAETLRSRRWLILLTVLLATGAAAAYAALADKVYEAEAEMLVTPVASNDPTLAGFGLIQESSDPTRDVETAARLSTSLDVANRVRRSLRLESSGRSLLERVSAEPVAQSNIVVITAEAGTPREARDLANGFAQGVVNDRTEQFHRQLDLAIERLRGQVQDDPRGGTGSIQEESLQDRLTRLETLRAGPDPTIRVETRADQPTSPVSPRPKISIAAGLVAGLVLGIAGAFGLQALDPRLRREEQLRGLYSLPVLARIPRESRSGKGALSPDDLSPAAVEAYRTLRATLTASSPDRDEPQSILVTGGSPSEGKSTTAINLAASLALAGNKVILIEADLRRPSIGEALGVPAQPGTVSVLLEATDLRDALITTRAYGPNLQMLLAGTGSAGGWLADRLILPAAERLVKEAERLADFVIIDSPPLTEVIDALPLAQTVDRVLLVVRLGKSQLSRLTQLGELLAQHGVSPAGFAVVGVPSSKRSGYYQPTARRPLVDWSRRRSSRVPTPR